MSCWKKIFVFGLITIWENTDSCAKHYIGATPLYLFYIFSQAFGIFIYRGISVLGHDIEFVDGLNDTKKRFIFHLIATVKLTGIQRFDTQMTVHISTHNAAVILEEEFKKHFPDASHKHFILDNGRHKKCQVKKWTNREYHVQHNEYVYHQEVKMYCATK